MRDTSRTGREDNGVSDRKNRIRLALLVDSENLFHRQLAVQAGLRYAIVDPAARLARRRRAEYGHLLAQLREEFERAGLAIAGLEGSITDVLPMDRIKLGLPGRDEEIENFAKLVEAMGQAGIPLLCYDFMAGIGWYRTRVDVPGRGGALVSEFDYEQAESQGLTSWGRVPEETIWENLEYFLRIIVPVAERAGVRLALHPDDPPVSPLRGVGRILTSGENFRRALALLPSPAHGIAFCQANFRLMGEDLEALIREWCAQDKIFFVHFRDVAGHRFHFRETFHDEGPTDMGRMLRVYWEAGFDGPLRPDHAPTMAGEPHDRPGYAIYGRLIAIGYIRGLLEGQEIPYE